MLESDVLESDVLWYGVTMKIRSCSFDYFSVLFVGFFVRCSFFSFPILVLEWKSNAGNRMELGWPNHLFGHFVMVQRDWELS